LWPGIHTLELSRLFSGKEGTITATDINEEYLEALRHKITEQKVDNVVVEKADMFNLNYDDSSFDIVWAEGAIFIIGFEKGLKEWKRLLKPNGMMIVSELSWLKSGIPKETSDFWAEAYPRIQSIEENIKNAKQCGYYLDSHFTIPESAWFNDYYTPMEKRIGELTEKYRENEEAQLTLSRAKAEIDMYKNYSSYYGYEFYILRAENA
jgi:ubiquinone/menaquinone biosynthesis C-methylase UbiE